MHELPRRTDSKGPTAALKDEEKKRKKKDTQAGGCQTKKKHLCLARYAVPMRNPVSVSVRSRVGNRIIDPPAIHHRQRETENPISQASGSRRAPATDATQYKPETSTVHGYNPRGRTCVREALLSTLPSARSRRKRRKRKRDRSCFFVVLIRRLGYSIRLLIHYLQKRRRNEREKKNICTRPANS